MNNCFKQLNSKLQVKQINTGRKKTIIEKDCRRKGCRICPIAKQKKLKKRKPESDRNNVAFYKKMNADLKTKHDNEARTKQKEAKIQPEKPKLRSEITRHRPGNK